MRARCTVVGDGEGTYHLQDPKRGQQRCRHVGLAGRRLWCEPGRIGGECVERRTRVAWATASTERAWLLSTAIAMRSSSSSAVSG